MDWFNLLGYKEKWDSLCKEMSTILMQKNELGLISREIDKKIKISNRLPDMLFIVANHNPRSKILRRELNVIVDSEEYKYLRSQGCQIKIAVVPNTQLELFEDNNIPIDVYIKTSPQQRI